MKRSPESAPFNTSLNYEDAYICPVCRHGQISALVLMDAFACNFCRHIFTANLQEQSVQIVDNSQPLAWRWTGQAWRMAHQMNADQTLLIWVVGLALVLFPTTLIGVMSYMFPPLGGTASRFPQIWTGLTFLLHFLLVAWLIAEHHQFALYVSCKVRLQSLMGRR